jgi:hypothetical protein
MHDNDRPAAQSGAATPDDQRPAKPPFEEPRLAFIEPKLTPRGDLREVTGFFGGFSP